MHHGEERVTGQFVRRKEKNKKKNKQKNCESWIQMVADRLAAKFIQI